MLIIPIDSHSQFPLYEQIYQFIKTEIQEGHLPYQTKLPSTRGLSSHLGVSRITVETAYSQLHAEGYLEVFPKRGYFIAKVSALTSLPSLESPLIPSETQDVTPSFPYDFSPFEIDLGHFPYSIWRRLSKNCLVEEGSLFSLGENQGDEALRHAICSYLHQSRGVRCSSSQLIIGAGVDYLLQLLSLLLPKDMLIAMENPSYKRAFQIFDGLGFSICPLPLDESGLRVDLLTSSGASLAYVTPSHQYPLGIVMPIKRRMELLQWASEGAGRYIIEDDHDSEFRYIGKPIPSLQGIDKQNKVIYIGTFSKAIAPAIRVGYMVLPPSLLAIYRSKYHYYSSTVSRIDQAILADFISKGHFERHLNRMRKLYKAKHDCLMVALSLFGGSLSLWGENAGLHLVIRLKTSVSEDEILKKAAEAGIRLYGLSEYYLEPKAQEEMPSFLIGYGNLSEKEIQEGISLFYELCKKFIFTERISCHEEKN